MASILSCSQHRQNVDCAVGQEPTPKDVGPGLAQANAASAALIGFISRSLVERHFFQNRGTPPEMLLYLANDLIRALSPQKQETLNMAKELSLSWRQWRGHSLTPTEQAYLDRPKQLDVMGEILNGLKYSSIALLGQNFYGSVTSAVNQRLWHHVPAICGYYGLALGGAQAVSVAVSSLLADLPREQAVLLEPWLNVVGKLALGLAPRVHATEQGVHYHYPSTEGHTQTVSPDQTVTLRGETITVEKGGHLNTPEGSFEGTYEAEFKLDTIYEMNEERVRIRVLDKEGTPVPVVFTKTQGPYGPQIVVSSENKELEQQWARYFRPQQSTLPPPDPEARLYEGLSCKAGLALGLVGVSSGQPALGVIGAALCIPGARAAPANDFARRMEAAIIRPNFFDELEECERLIDKGKASADVYYYYGMMLKQLGRYKEAEISFGKALEAQRDHTKALSEREKIIKELSSPVEARKAFFKAIGMDVPSDYTYVAMAALAYCGIEELRSCMDGSLDGYVSGDLRYLDKHCRQLRINGWKLGKSNDELGVQGNDYFGVAFIHPETKRLIVAHRGTEGIEDGINDLIMISANPPPQCEQAVLFTEALEKKYLEYDISHAGHSLGAAIAGLLAYKRGEAAVTVESPGVRHIIELEYHQQLSKTPAVVSPAIINYVAIPNLVNTCAQHLGHLKAIRPTPLKIPEGSRFFTETSLRKAVRKAGVALAAKLGNLVVGPSISDLVTGDLASHSILPLLDAFRAEVGLSNDHCIVSLWPKGTPNWGIFWGICRESQLNPLGVCVSSNPRMQAAFEGFDYMSTPVHPSRLKLSAFSDPEQQMLKDFRKLPECGVVMDPRVLRLYHIEGDEIVICSDPGLFTAEDFRSYIQHKYKKDLESGPNPVPNPLHSCCKIEKKEDKNSTERSLRERFFQLPSIQKLTASHEQLQEFFDKDNQAGFDALLHYLDRSIEENIESDLQRLEGRMSEWNYETLCDELFDPKPVAGQRFSSVMHHDGVFFLGKALQLRSHGKVLMKSRKIVGFERGCRNLVFRLQDDAKVVVKLGKECLVDSISFTVQDRHSFLNHIGSISPGDEFDLETEKTGELPEWLRPGHYRVSSSQSTEHSKMVSIEEMQYKHSYNVEIVYAGVSTVFPQNVTIKELNRDNAFADLDTIRHCLKVINRPPATQIPVTSVDQQADNIISIQPFPSGGRAENEKQIHKQTESLVNALLQNPSYVDRFIDHLMEIKFRPVSDVSWLNDPSLTFLGPSITSLEKLYASIHKPEKALSILQNIIYEVNYQRLIKATTFEGGIFLSETMQLLAEAGECLKDIKGKDIVLFIGDTGSGKSTTIRFLLGDQLKRITSPAGQKVYESTQNESGPKIGHSLTTSETSYTRGYLSEKTSLVLVDTPGLGDTRSKMALGAMLSIDQAIRHAKAVRALVLTIPWSYLSGSGRGNMATEFMKEVDALLPGYLSDDILQSVHILITKEEGSQKSLGDMVSSFSSDETNPKNKIIWDALTTLFSEGRLRPVRVKNVEARKQHLAEYQRSPEIPTGSFRTLMRTDYMKRQLGDQVNTAVAIWKKDIFDMYMEAHSQQKRVKEDVIRCKKALDDATIELNDARKELEQLKVSGREEFKKKCIDQVREHQDRYDRCVSELKRLEHELMATQGAVNEITARIERNRTAELIVGVVGMIFTFLATERELLGGRLILSIGGPVIVIGLFDQLFVSENVDRNRVFFFPLATGVLGGSSYLSHLARTDGDVQEWTMLGAVGSAMCALVSYGVSGEITPSERLKLTKDNYDKQKKSCDKLKGKIKEEQDRCDRDAIHQELLKLQDKIATGEKAAADATRCIEEAGKELDRLKRNTKYLAVVIKTRRSVAEYLNKLCEIVVPMYRELEAKASSRQGDLEPACAEYKTFYAANWTKILQQCQDDLGVACGPQESASASQAKDEL